MSLQLINGVFYAEFKLDNIDNKALVDQITDIYLNEGKRMSDEELDIKSRPLRGLEDVDIQHTFYEDCPIPLSTKQKFITEIKKITNNNFGEDTFTLEEIWGHFTAPLGYTMVHDHAGGGGGDYSQGYQLSWVYYPHQPKNAGDINFIATINGGRVCHEVPIKSGCLYMFSSNILHFVPRNASGQNRISVSGNLRASDQFIEVLREDHEFKNNYWYFAGRNENLVG